MKKYMTPETTVSELEPTQILAGSGYQNVDETELGEGYGTP